MTTVRSFARLTVALTAMLPFAALAGAPPTGVPEPGTWALVVLAGVIGVAIVRSKRK